MSTATSLLDHDPVGLPRPAALTVRNLRVSFRSRRHTVDVVHGVDLDVARGELVALLGESGSGKSVTARAVTGLSAPGAEVTADQIALGDSDLLHAAPTQLRQWRGPRIALVFQDALSALNPVLSIADQIGDLLRAHTDLSRRERHRRAVDLLDQVGIPGASGRVDDYPHQFSGGMRQRILIAMAVALEPELLIADEPTTALDVTVQAQILDLIDRLRRELTMGVLLITHDLGVVSEVADRVTVMYAGRVVENGDGDDVLTTPAHPYTSALLQSVPRPDLGRDALAVIPGAPPAPGRLPTGCSFHPRCSWRIDRCMEQRPTLETMTPSWSAACYRHEEVRRDA